MRINIFEGCRRVVRLIAVVGIGVGAWNLVFPSPFVKSVVLLKAWTPPALIKACPYPGQTEMIWREESPIKGATIEVCFDSSIQGASSRELRQKVVRDYLFLDDLRPKIERSVADSISEDRKETAQILGAFLIILFGLSYVIGWIVRGFAGIKRGHDHRETGA
jgi:hypothetical protein